MQYIPQLRGATSRHLQHCLLMIAQQFYKKEMIFMPAYKDEKTGKWFAKFYYTNWQGIKKQKWKRGFATKKEALAYERDFLEKQSANPDMTFQNLYELYMEDMTPRLKQSTIMTKKHICETHILPFFGNKPVNEIKASDVRRWQNQLMNSPKGYSKTYLKTINNQLTCIINYAKRFYDLNTNPCGQAGSIGQAKAEEMDYWTYDEYIAFREGIKDKPLSYICFQVLYWTGMREGELLALTATLPQNRLISTKLSNDFMEKMYLHPLRRERASERFPFRIFFARNFRNIWTQDICLTRKKGCFRLQNLIYPTRWTEVVGLLV